MNRMLALPFAAALFLSASAAVAADPPSDAAALAAIEKLSAADLENALKSAREYVAQHPQDLRGHVLREDLELAAGHEREVVDAYREPARAETASADAHYLLARLLRGNPAITEFRAALKADPQHFWAMCGLGIELTRTGGHAEAKNVLEEAAKLQPSSSVPVNALGRLEEARGKLADAEKRYRAAMELDPASIVTRVNLGMLLVRTSRPDEAMKVLKEAASAAPKDPLPLVAIGMAYLAAKDPKSAVDSFQRAATIDLASVAALNLLAKAFIEADQLELAETPLQKALARAPEDVSTKLTLAYVRIQKGQFEEATQFATAAVHADDSCAQAHYVLALCYDHALQGKKADAEFRRAEKLDDADPLFVRGLAAFAAGQGDWKTSIAEYQKLVKMTDNSSEAQVALAGAYVGAGRAKDAASTYDKVVAAEPTRLDAWLALGMVCMRDLKELRRASKAFHEYKERGGKDPRVDGWLAQLDVK